MINDSEDWIDDAVDLEQLLLQVEEHFDREREAKKEHLHAIMRLSATYEYQIACSRKNCAFAALWFITKYSDTHTPYVAQFMPGGGVLIQDFAIFSDYYWWISNTEKKKESKNNFAYACRQNLENHLLLLCSSQNRYYYYHPNFRADLPVTAELIVSTLRPWKKTLPKEQRVLLKSIATNAIRTASVVSPPSQWAGDTDSLPMPAML